jgi:hypothetical protein
MITNFEKITYDLTSDEKKALSALVDILKFRHKMNPIKAPALVERIKEVAGLKKYPQARLRKMINLLRSKSILPVIGTSEGYYLSEDRGELMKEIKSLQERAGAIISASEGLMVFVEREFKKEVEKLEGMGGDLFGV